MHQRIAPDREMTPVERMLLDVHNRVFVTPAVGAYFTDGPYPSYYFVYADGTAKERYSCGSFPDYPQVRAVVAPVERERQAAYRRELFGEKA